jgi:membrane-bound lytic murein transglycosylase D
MRIFAALFFAAVLPVAAQTPQVPHKMEFAGITLIIREDARNEIQRDVDALTKSPKHYNIKVERARSYFPIIEKVFAEERLPDDFKYLALQESALIADAVSVSNAVGFWQFKDFTAIEMGLRVDREVDERLNIASSSRAAARYIKKNNTFFDNWIYALQAYQMGAGGVMKSVKDTKAGVTRMEIDGDTYWYIKKYLAHKIAYEPAVGPKGEIQVITYENKNGKSLGQIAQEVGVNEADLLVYNKWTKSGRVPDDRTYIVAIPLIGQASPIQSSVTLTAPEKKEPGVSVSSSYRKIPMVKKRINGIQTIQAGEGETAPALAARAEVSVAKFLKWNDMEASTKIIAGEYYYLGKKRGRAEENFHKAVAGENLWSISQQYGVQLRRLKKFNRVESNMVTAGTMLYLASTRPKSEEFKPGKGEEVAIDQSETFNWEVSATKNSTSIKDTITLPVITASTESDPIIPVSSNDTVSKTQTNPENPVDSDPKNPAQIVQETTIAETDSIDTENDNNQGAVLVQPRKSEHIVQAKETLYSIAKIYSVGVMELVRWNNLDLQQGLKIGQVLKLSENQTITKVPKNQVSMKDVVHEVKSSDTLYSIARLYGVTIKDLMDWNEKKDFSLSVGEKLKIQQRQ